jgi:hypothetical protein
VSITQFFKGLNLQISAAFTVLSIFKLEILLNCIQEHMHKFKHHKNHRESYSYTHISYFIYFHAYFIENYEHHHRILSLEKSAIFAHFIQIFSDNMKFVWITRIIKTHGQSQYSCHKSAIGLNKWS